MRHLTAPGRLVRLLVLIIVALGVVAVLPPTSSRARSADWHADSAGVLVEPQVPAEGLDLIGALQLPGGSHGDIWVHNNTAYVGTWRSPCSGAGVKAVDVSDPARPRLAATLASYAGTTAEDVVVINAATPTFRGDLLAVGLQVCDRGGVAGVDFWDVGNPNSPRHLGFLGTPGTTGVHELHLFQRGERVLALLAVPYSETRVNQGDFRIVDVADPTRPVQVSQWGALRDLGVSRGEARGSFPAIYGHSASVSPDGHIAYVSYWDAGLILLDISDPERPTYLNRITYAGWEGGDTHSAYSQDGRILAVADELLHAPWAFLRLYDISNLRNPIGLATVDTPHRRGERDSYGPPQRGAWYSAHNPIIRGNRLYVSWFGDGVRLLDISNPAAPWEIASFVPPQEPEVWGVAVQNNLVYLSDINNGLYILRHAGAPTTWPTPPASPPIRSAVDWAVAGGWFYTQAVGQPGQGFAVTDEAGVHFWSEFQRLGGVDGVGYPISQRFVWDGFVSQAFQKMVFQWRPEVNQVYAVNVVDLMGERGLDPWLRAFRATPGIADWSADAGQPWPEVVAAHQALLTDPDLRAAYFAVADPVTIYGLPMAPVQDMGNVLVLRAQRGILQKWLVDVPWARAGQVTIANSGDVAKEAGLLPPDALIAQAR
ncbi:MAG TPA: hypothetical protein VHL09_13000 [Dehalococcoidia bacterium]|nr:hypothetical protein [Dehalococcoidia bacterium]